MGRGTGPVGAGVVVTDQKQLECVREVVLTNPTGLHARPATAFVDRATKFQSEIILRKGNRVANGKSIIDILTLGAERGARIVMTTRGPDAGVALDSLVQLLEELDGN